MMSKPHRSVAAFDRLFDFKAVDTGPNANHSSAFKTIHTFCETSPDYLLIPMADIRQDSS